MKSPFSHNQFKTVVKPALFTASLLPLIWYLYGFFSDSLGANPIEAITRASGEWALRFLWLTLFMTPLRWLTGWAWWLQLRRMLGLYSFFYAAVHFIIYLWLDQFFDWQGILLDIVERPFITAGFIAVLILLPLAATSLNRVMRAMGKRWRTLHKSVYVAAIASALHFFWMKASKSDVSEPMIYIVLLVWLFGYRLYKNRAPKIQRKRVAGSQAANAS